MTRLEILQAAHMELPETRIEVVRVKIRKIHIQEGESEIEFYSIKGHYAESTKPFAYTVSSSKANSFNISRFEDDKFHLLKIQMEFKRKGITGYVQKGEAIAHQSDGWTIAEVLEQISETSADYKLLTSVNKVNSLFKAINGREYSSAIAKDVELYNQYLRIALM